MTFSFEDRSKQKAAARARDETRLARGEISAAELQQENNQFRGLRKRFTRVYYIPAGRRRPGDRGPYFTVPARTETPPEDDDTAL